MRAPRYSLALLLLTTACLRGPTPSVRPGPERRAPTPSEERFPAPPPTLSDLEYLRSRKLMVPVAGIAPAKIPDTFTAKRGTRIHEAVDLMAPRGTRVIAADDGRIARLGRNDLGGIVIYAVDSAERFVYYYAHLDRYAEGLAEGMAIAKGDLLGYVGTTGNAPANAPHLHFQLMKLVDQRMWWSGPPLDPRPLFTTPGTPR
ncbi:MAG: M23 family metallopeptidase [Gemmatimonadaceae bacterium]|nr:M23 family metallopeptidase [Gemmatimonadaceae bacterium]